MDSGIMKKLVELMDQRVEVALVTVTSKTGSGPRDKGSMMLVDKKGELLYGTIGGGGVEERAKKDAKMCIDSNQSEAFHYELTMKESEHALGMACGGMVDVFVKVFRTGSSLIIFGGGHIGLELTRFAKALDYTVTVVDEREAFSQPDRLQGADRVLTGDPVSLLETLHIDQETYIIIVTHGHRFDLDVLRAVLDSQAAYIGMIGSVNKINFCFKELIKEGVEKASLQKIYAPIGLDIGGETPAEIALSILSEIQAVKNGKEAPFLRERRRAKIVYE